MDKRRISRRAALKSGLAVSALASLQGVAEADAPAATRKRIRQSVCRWCYQKIPLPEFCKAVAEMGLTAIDLVEEKDWGVLADHGLHCSMAWKTGTHAR